VVKGAYYTKVTNAYELHEQTIAEGFGAIEAHARLTDPDATVHVGDKKTEDRAVEKAKLAHDGDMSLTLDYKRAACVCNGAEVAFGVVDYMLSDASPFPVVRIKNRLGFKYPAMQKSGAYRDVQLICEIPRSGGLLLELQVHVRGFYNIMRLEGGHGKYRDYRVLKEKSERKLLELAAKYAGKGALPASHA